MSWQPWFHQLLFFYHSYDSALHFIPSALSHFPNVLIFNVPPVLLPRLAATWKPLLTFREILRILYGFRQAFGSSLEPGLPILADIEAISCGNSALGW